jgi:hypothetical protein
MNALATYSLCRFEIKSWWKCRVGFSGEAGGENTKKRVAKARKKFSFHMRNDGDGIKRTNIKKEEKLFVWILKHMSMKIMLYELFRKFVSSLLGSFSLNVDEKLFTHPPARHDFEIEFFLCFSLFFVLLLLEQ